MKRSKARRRRRPRYSINLFIIIKCPICRVCLYAHGNVPVGPREAAKASALEHAREFHSRLCPGRDEDLRMHFVDDEDQALEELTGDELPLIH